MKGWAAVAIGRRKSSVARVFLKNGEGTITVNGRTSDDYFRRETLRMIIAQPLVLLSRIGKYDLVINVSGGGLSGQAGAVRLGLSRALIKLNAEDRPQVKKAGFLSRDPREVERKKYGRHKARKRPQYSKR